MPPTTRRTLAQKVSSNQYEIIIPDNLVIKTEKIDEAYEAAYTNYPPLFGNKHGSLAAIKQEPPDFNYDNVRIKTENFEDEQQTSVIETRPRTRSSLSRLTVRNDLLAKNISNSSSNVLVRSDRTSRTSRQKEAQNTRCKSSKPCSNGSPRWSISTIRSRAAEKQHDLHSQRLKGCILHMKNILDAKITSKDNSRSNSISNNSSSNNINNNSRSNINNNNSRSNNVSSNSSSNIHKNTPSSGVHNSGSSKIHDSSSNINKNNNNSANDNDNINNNSRSNNNNNNSRSNNVSDNSSSNIHKDTTSSDVHYSGSIKIHNSSCNINKNNSNANSANDNDNNLNSIAEQKRLRQRVKLLIPQHMRFPKGHYKCYSCNIEFNLLAEWEDHMCLYFQQKGCFPKDWNQAATIQKYKGNWRISNDKKKFFCNFCSFETKHKQDVYQHIVARHEPQCHKCAVCYKMFNTLHYLKNHLSYKHDPTRTPLKCSQCQYKTIDKYSLKTHIRTKHTKEGYIMCDQCNVKTPTTYRMKMHKMRAHSSGSSNKKLYKCTNCSYVSSEFRRLREHFKRSHSDEEIYSCADCNYKGNKHYLEMHIYKMHMQDKIEKKFKCDICDKLFPSESGLTSHNRMMHNNGPELIACKYCQLVFLTKHDCYIHANIVHEAKPEFSCNECSYVALNKDDLREHIFKKHRFKFYCAYCQFTTHAKIYIYIHINSKHNPKSRRFKCSKCKYAAKNKTLLKQHMNVKHNPNPIMYTCFHCGHNNKIKHKLSQHMQTKHLNLLCKKTKKKTKCLANKK